MNVPSRFVVILVLAFGIATTAASEAADAGLEARIDRFLTEHMDENPVPGFSAVVVRDDQILFAKGYGVRVLGEPGRVTARSPIGIGSQTKSFTAFAVLQLVERGLIELDAPLVRYLPWFETADRRGDEITIRMLLHNTSGIPSIDRWLTSSDRSEDAAVRSARQLSSVALVREPGESFEYANENWTLLGVLITELTGLPYSRYMQEHVFEPLGMHDTTTALELFDEKRVLYGHYPGIETARPARPRFLAEALAAGSEMRASATDMGRYLIALIGGGSLDGKQLLDPSSVDLLFEPGVTTSLYMEEMGAIGEEAGYAMGWVESEAEGRTMHHHGGDAIVMTSWTMIDREAGVGASVLYNGPSLDAYQHPTKIWLAHSLIRLTRGEEPSRFGLPIEGDPLANDYELPDELLARYVGEYVSQTGFRAEISLDSSARELIVTAGSLDLDYVYKVDFASESSVVLRNMSGGTSARFFVTPSGKVTGIEGGLFGGTYRRVEERDAGHAGVVSSGGEFSLVLPETWTWEPAEAEIIARSEDNATLLVAGLRDDDWTQRRQEILSSSDPETTVERRETIGPWVWDQVLSSDGASEPATQTLVASANVGLRRFEITLTAEADELTRAIREVLLPVFTRLEVRDR